MNIKHLIGSIFLLGSLFCNSQNFNYVDEIVENYSQFKTLEELSNQIEKDFKTDTDRVRAAFYWVATKMNYGKNLDEFFQAPKLFSYLTDHEKETKLSEIKYENRTRAFSNQRGVCVDYSSIFQEICSNFGLETALIKGLTKNEISILTSEKQYKNHVWNAVKINGVWKLFDCTWASGFFDNTANDFIKKFNGFYFDTNPNTLIKSHFPKEQKWQLLDKKINLSTFLQGPIFYPEFFKRDLKLADNTSGHLKILSSGYSTITLKNLPRDQQLFYKSAKKNLRKVKTKKVDQFHVIKLKTKLLEESGEYFTFYLESDPIVRFKINTNVP